MLMALRDEERIPALSYNLHHQGGNKATQLQSPSTVMVLRLMLLRNLRETFRNFTLSCTAKTVI